MNQVTIETPEGSIDDEIGKRPNPIRWTDIIFPDWTPGEGDTDAPWA